MFNRDRLVELREERHWRREDLAVRTRLSTSAIGHYERGVRSPRPGSLQRLADAFGVEPDELVAS